MRGTSAVETRDAFGWLKTLGLIVIVFAVMIASGVMAAKAADSGCQAACDARNNQCRIERKGAPSCDAELNVCRRHCFEAAARQHAPPPKKP